VNVSTVLFCSFRFISFISLISSSPPLRLILFEWP
jgi:hypothetical protein